MADNIAVTAGTGTTVATDDVAGTHYQRVKLVDGTLDASTAIAAGGGVEAGALRVTVASDSTGVLSVDDNGSTLSVDDGAGSLTVDGTVTANAGTGTFTVSATDLDIRNLAPATDEVKVTGAAADGAAVAGNPILIAGQDGTNAQSIKTDAAGELQVDVLTLPSVTVGAALPAGTNNVGDVDIASIAAGDNNIGNVDLASAIPAGTNNIGDVDVASVATGQGKTLLFASIDTATSGNNTIVAADASNKIKLVSYVLVSTSALSVRWIAGATNKSGAMALAANGGISAIGQPSAHLLETAVNEALILNLSAATQVSGHISYWKEA